MVRDELADGAHDALLTARSGDKGAMKVST